MHTHVRRMRILILIHAYTHTCIHSFDRAYANTTFIPPSTVVVKEDVEANGEGQWEKYRQMTGDGCILIVVARGQHRKSMSMFGSIWQCKLIG